MTAGVKGMPRDQVGCCEAGMAWMGEVERIGAKSQLDPQLGFVKCKG